MFLLLPLLCNLAPKVSRAPKPVMDKRILGSVTLAA